MIFLLDVDLEFLSEGFLLLYYFLLSMYLFLAFCPPLTLLDFFIFLMNVDNY